MIHSIIYKYIFFLSLFLQIYFCFQTRLQCHAFCFYHCLDCSSFFGILNSTHLTPRHHYPGSSPVVIVIVPLPRSLNQSLYLHDVVHLQTLRHWIYVDKMVHLFAHDFPRDHSFSQNLFQLYQKKNNTSSSCRESLLESTLNTPTPRPTSLHAYLQCNTYIIYLYFQMFLLVLSSSDVINLILSDFETRCRQMHLKIKA